MADKSPKKNNSKKPGKSLKEKRADKHAKKGREAPGPLTNARCGPMTAAEAIRNTFAWFEVNSGWAQPDDDNLAEWVADGACRCPDECIVAPDGWCEHGLASWLADRAVTRRLRRRYSPTTVSSSSSSSSARTRRLDLVSDRADVVERLPGRVVELPVEVPLAGVERAGVAAAHRDHDVGRAHELVGRAASGTPARGRGRPRSSRPRRRG